MTKGMRVFLMVFVIIIVSLIAGVFMFSYRVTHDAVEQRTAAAVTTTGNAAIGGPFQLVDSNNQPVTDADFRGKLMLVYFGFTFCPDICPTDLLVISNVIEKLGEDASKVAPIFISVDPERDTPEHLKTYMENFNPNITALTGAPEAIADVAKEYKVYYKRIDDGTTKDYLVDHTAIKYLMDKDGNFITHFPPNVEVDAIVAKIKENL